MTQISQQSGLLDISGLFPEELAVLDVFKQAPAYRVRQVFSWMHARQAATFADMTDLPAALREKFTEQYAITAPRQARVEQSLDGTKKYLFALHDGQTVETVVIPDDSRITVCVSTQVGCPFKCVFCATGQAGFVRNLTAGEIIGQVYRAQSTLPPGVRVTNIVYMGMGEPFGNYEAVMRSVRLLIHPQGMNLAQRRITISTVGIIPGIERLIDEELQVNLAISLHAPIQAARVALVPVAKKYPLDALMSIVKRYVRRTGRKVSFEYTVVPGRNDSPLEADALAKLVRGMQCMVNVIPLNTGMGTTDVHLTPPELDARAEQFVGLLKTRHVEAALRRSRGRDISGACGQLRQRHGG